MGENNAEVKYSIFATISGILLIILLISLFTLNPIFNIIISFLTLIFGIIGFIDIKRHPGLKGKTQTIFSMVLGSIIFILYIFMIYGLLSGSISFMP